MALRELSYNSINYSVSYEILNKERSDTIVFLHGWGSNKEIMKQAFGSKLIKFRLIFLDLPGFGNSSIKIPITTADYARIVKKFLDSLSVKNFSIVAHSFGGKIATLLRPKNLMLLSSAGILVKKSFKVKIKIKLFKFFKHILPKTMYKFFISEDVKEMNQAMYETFKSVVDEDFRPIFQKVTSKTLIFWGKNDSATPLSSGKEIAQIIRHSTFYQLDGDHFFFVKNSKFIAKAIDEQL